MTAIWPAILLSLNQVLSPYQPDSSSIDQLIKTFCSSEWVVVENAALELEEMGADALPYLVALLARDEAIPLQDTFDLIYPGMDRFYGHGYSVWYDIDWLSVRAGWLIERITFEDFGFRESAMSKSPLLAEEIEHQRRHPKSPHYLSHTMPQVRMQLRAEAAERTKEWWDQNRLKWNRLESIYAAMESNDRRRVESILQWIRFGETTCPGLDLDSFDTQVMPIVKELVSSTDNQLSRHAELIIQGDHDRRFCGLCGTDMTRNYAAHYRSSLAAIRHYSRGTLEANNGENPATGPLGSIVNIGAPRCPRCGYEKPKCTR